MTTLVTTYHLQFKNGLRNPEFWTNEGIACSEALRKREETNQEISVLKITTTVEVVAIIPKRS